MSLTNVKLAKNRRVYVARAKEATYGAGGTTLDMVLNCRHGEGEYLQRVRMNVLNDITATGYEQPTQQLHLGHDTPQITVSVLAAAESLGWALGFLGGSDTKSGTTNITHAIVPIALTSGFPGSTEMEDHRAGANTGVTSPTDIRAKGIYVTETVISGGRTGWVNHDISVRGNGSVGTAANQTETGMAQPGRDSGYFPGQTATLGLKAPSAQHDPAALTYTTPSASLTAANITVANSWGVFTDELDTWTVTMTNVYAEETTRSVGQGSTNGLVGSCPVLIHRMVKVSLTFTDETTFDDYFSILNTTSDSSNFERSFGLELVNDKDINTSDFAGVLIHVPIMFAEQNASGTYGDRNTLTLNLTSGQSMGVDAYPVWRAFVHDGYNGVYCQA